MSMSLLYVSTIVGNEFSKEKSKNRLVISQTIKIRFTHDSSHFSKLIFFC